LNDGLENELERVLVSEEVDDLKSLSEDADSHLFLTVLARGTEHELVDKSLEDWACNLLESLLLILASGVRDVHLRFFLLNGHVSSKGLLRAVHILVRPLSEKLGFDGKSLLYTEVRMDVLKCSFWVLHKEDSLTGFYV
jgi:hypothetical protein